MRERARIATLLTAALLVAPALACAGGFGPGHAALDAIAALAADTSTPDSLAPARQALRDSVTLPDSAIVHAAPPAAEKRGRNPIRSLRRGATAFASDLWWVATSPARMTKTDVLWLGGALAITGVTFAHDEEIREVFNRNEAANDPAWQLLLKPGRQWEPVGFMGNTNKYYVGALVVGWALDVEPLTVIPAQILESHLIAGGVRNAVKAVVGRSRPFENRGPRHFEFLGGSSFPSGHTSVDFELATILSHHIDWKPATVALYYLATSLALERIESDGHWPSDILLSAMQGTLVARTVIRRHERRERAEREPGLRSHGTSLELRDGVPTVVWRARF